MEKNAEAYKKCGIDKLVKGDLDGAIADFDKAIDIDPNFAYAYCNRGVAKRYKGDFDGAIDDYDKAIELNRNDADFYSNRGTVKSLNGDINGAIADYDKAIKIDPNCVNAYYNYGIIKLLNGDFDNAIVYFNRIIDDLDGNNLVLEYYCRGIIKINKKDLDGAMKDFNKANSCDSILAASIPLLYIVQKFKEESETFLRLYLEITNLRRKIATYEKMEVMHFTNLDTLRDLAKGNKFRLFNSSHMHDNTEGQIFFDLLGSSIGEKVQKSFGSKHISNIFIGSFIQNSSELEKDSLMWRLYGKHAGKESAGCLVFFDIDSSQKSRKLINSSILENAITIQKEKSNVKAELFSYGHELVGKVRNEECILYRVLYRDKKELKKLREIGKNLNDIIDLIKNTKFGPEKKEQIQRWIGNLLSEVRFLFKHESYQREREVRFVIDRKEQIYDGTKPEDDMPERTYVECPELKIKRVVLGPAVERGQEWKDWLSRQEVSKDWEVLLYGDSKKTLRKPRKK